LSEAIYKCNFNKKLKKEELTGDIKDIVEMTHDLLKDVDMDAIRK